MVRSSGRAPRGQRLIDYSPHGHWKTTTFVSALRHDKMTAPMVVDGAMCTPIFVAYVGQVLLKELQPGDIVIMDNLSSHKSAQIRELIESAGAQLVYLPPYSPDLNPIEMAFSKLKWLLKSAAERTVEGLWERVGKILDRFSATECRRYLNHCGYGLIPA
jgi:transposase